MKLRTAIFDWSGTLSDDLEAVYRATMDVFKHYRVPAISIDEFKQTFVLPYMNFYDAYVPQLVKEEADAIFREKFPQYYTVRIFPGTVEALSRLQQQGIQLAVVSAHYSEKLLEEVKLSGLTDCLKTVHGGITDKISAFPQLLREAYYDPAATCYVGDMAHDMRAGKAAGIKPIGVTWGYQDEERLRAAGAEEIVNDIGELVELLSSW